MQKIGIVLASSLLLGGVACSDEPQKVEPQQIEDGIRIFRIPQSPLPSTDSAFVVPIPKDNSEFTIKPPSGGTIVNPALNPPPQSSRTLDQILRIQPWGPKSPAENLNPRRVFMRDDVLRARPLWHLENAPLSQLLSQLQRSYKVQIRLSLSPDRPLEDVKISMILSGTTVEEKLSSLGVLGLVWRKVGEAYYVAWDEKDLPSIAPAIVPVPR